MALVLADRVKETTTTTGTGTVTLAGASAGFQSFSAIGNGNTTYYTIAGGTEWEVGIGTYTSAGTTLSRDTVLASSAGGTTKVTFSAGTKDVFVTYPAEKSVNYDASNNVAIGSVAATEKLNVAGSLLLSSGAVKLDEAWQVQWGSGVSYINATNTSFYANAGGQRWVTATSSSIALSTSGSERMRIDSSGNALIGTTAVGNWSILTAYGASSTGFAGISAVNNNSSTGIGGIQFGSDSTYSKAAIGLKRDSANGVGSLIFYNSASTGAANWSTSDERMRITSAGFVGIGVTNPDKPLVVAADNGTAYAMNIRGRSSSTNESIVQFTNNANTVEFARIAAYGNDFDLINVQAYSVKISTSNTERMRIDASGNVGIGTSSPGTAVDVYRNTAATASYRVQNANTAYDSNFIATDGTGAAGFGYAGSTYGGYQGIVAAGSYWYATGAGGITLTTWNASAAIKFYTNSGSERMRIDASGNVGIGVTPQAPLDVLAGSNQRFMVRELGTGAVVLDAVNAANSAYQTLITNGSVQIFRTLATEAMRITGAGYVGVGTGAPGAQFENVGKTRLGANVAQASPSGTDILSTSHTALSGNGGNYLTIGQYGSGSGYAQWIQSSYQVPNTAVYSLILQPLGGYVGIGIATPSGKLDVRGATGTTAIINSYNDSASGNVASIFSNLQSNANSTSSYHYAGVTQGVNIWYLYGNGTSSWSSDQRLKKNIETTRDGYLDDLCKLRVVKYNWHLDAEDKPRELGLIAQEVEEVFPGLVEEALHTLDETETKYKVLKGSVLPYMLLKALQEANSKIDTLSARVARLEGK